MPNIVTITLEEWDAAGLSYDDYKNDRKRGKLRTINRGGGAENRVLIDFNSLKVSRQRVIISAIGDPRKRVQTNTVKARIVPDAKALEYFTGYLIDDDRYLPDENVKEYCANAEVLNAIHEVIKSRTAWRKSRQISTTRMWEQIVVDVKEIKEGNALVTLPENQTRLKEKYASYLSEGYETLIHKGFKNSNRRKVTDDMKRLLLSIAAMPNKPFNTTIQDIYLQFVGGGIDIVDCETGEIFNRTDFFDKKTGAPITISKATVWNYINDPHNLAILDRVRMSQHKYNSAHRPHVHRITNVEYSLSKISMDDRDLRKMPNGVAVKAYYAYDIKSGALIGKAYSQSKDKSLFVECMRDMFRFLNANDLGMPLEVEVENHLANKFKDDLLKAGEVFKYVRWCNPGNSQEKYAETANRELKYGYEKRYREGVGRHYAKLEVNNTKEHKVWNDEGMQVVEKYYTFEQIVADDLAAIEAYNNGKHRDQKKYPGMSRLDVFLANPNPNCASYEPALLSKYIGEVTETSVRRSQYVQVMYNKYQLPNPNVLAKLAPNNYKVEAYYIPTTTGAIDEVYLYQNESYICKATKIEKFSTARAEWTDKDKEVFEKQQHYIARFDKITKDGKQKLAKVSILNTDAVDEDFTPEVIPTPQPAFEGFDNIEELISQFDGEYNSSKALDEL
ncbi:hypothetical protein [Acetobacteroides hydrogenigenes]|uniref:Integrase catalytic domain-containing protein n=1 Tax=Acetobacteroides hydrogenigenes TaxID=979970 RepID=A0A4R2ECG5_9BACT|nr:hypothetical protein [Acetobacteroides hydrogenigenes]TCN63714.1 hypothetical protein CLV25_11564 [Acetobacteroides hydrogenigenes]